MRSPAERVHGSSNLSPSSNHSSSLDMHWERSLVTGLYACVLLVEGVGWWGSQKIGEI